MNKFNFLFFIGLFLSLTTFQSCGGKKEESVAKDTIPANIDANIIVGVGRIEPEKKVIKLSSEVSGIVKKIFVKPGDTLKAGDVILELNAEVENNQLQINAAQIQTRSSDLLALESQFQSAKVKFDFAKQKFERIKASLEKGAETKQNADNAEQEVKINEKEMERIKNQMVVINNQVNEIKAQRGLASVQQSKKYIRAPYNGMILTMDLTVGTAVNALSLVAEFAPECPLSVLTEVDEMFASEVQIGDSAYIRLSGSTEKIASGMVVETAPFLKKKSLFSENAGDLEDRRVREVRVRLLNGKSLLLGSRVECVIQNK